MKEKRLDIQGAFDYAGRMFEQIGTAFIRDSKQLPSFSPKVDEALQFHVTVMCNWPIGMEEWSFRRDRYFGKQCLEVRKDRRVQLAPEPLRRQYDLLMDHLNPTSQLTTLSKVIQATGVSNKASIIYLFLLTLYQLVSLSRFILPILVYQCLTLLTYKLRNL